MEDKTFRLFLATIIIVMMGAIGWVIYDNHIRQDRNGIHIDVPGVRIEWDDDNPHHRR